jgi:hypothetical protein
MMIKPRGYVYYHETIKDEFAEDKLKFKPVPGTITGGVYRSVPAVASAGI